MKKPSPAMDAHEMIDLGRSAEVKEPVPIAKSPSDEPSYPRFSVSDSVLEKLQKDCGKLDVGDRMMAMCDLEVCSASQDEYGKRREFKVRGMCPSGDVQSADDTEDESEEVKEES